MVVGPAFFSVRERLQNQIRTQTEKYSTYILRMSIVASTSAISKDLIYLHVSFDLSLQLCNIISYSTHTTPIVSPAKLLNVFPLFNVQESRQTSKGTTGDIRSIENDFASMWIEPTRLDNLHPVDAVQPTQRQIQGGSWLSRK